MDNNINLIDDYLSGSLNQEQLFSFENELASNVSMQKELAFQKNIVEGIKSFRKTELKSRLNSLDISGSVSSHLWQKIAIAASTVLISGGIALYISNKTANLPIVETSTTASVIAATEISNSTEFDDTQEIATQDEVPLKNEQSNSTKTETTPTISKPIKPTVKSSTEPASLENALPSMMSGDNEITIDHELDSDKNITTTSVKFDENGIKVFPENKKNRFHYKYYGNNVLVQIADYKDNIPAVLIDYPEKKEVFLNYKGIFYRLDKNKNWDILSNHVITNDNMIKVLKEKIK